MWTTRRNTQPDLYFSLSISFFSPSLAICRVYIYEKRNKPQLINKDFDSNLFALPEKKKNLKINDDDDDNVDRLNSDANKCCLMVSKFQRNVPFSPKNPLKKYCLLPGKLNVEYATKLSVKISRTEDTVQNLEMKPHKLNLMSCLH